jgi:hypothetical protein
VVGSADEEPSAPSDGRLGVRLILLGAGFGVLVAGSLLADAAPETCITAGGLCGATRGLFAALVLNRQTPPVRP